MAGSWTNFFSTQNVAAFRAAMISNDSYLGRQWYLRKIKAPEAWNINHEAPGVIIAVIDSAVDIDHPDLKTNVWKNLKEIPDNNIDDDGNGFIDDVNGWNFVEGNNNVKPQFSKNYTADVLHGTIVSGIIAASGNNTEGVSGVTWSAKIMPIKVLSDSGEGSVSSVIQAIDYAILNNANIINLSFVGSEYSQGLAEAIERAYKANIIVVAAAGNDARSNDELSLDKKPLYPVCMDGPISENRVIGVAATDAIDQKANFSGFGKNCIDISAPGISVYGLSVYSPTHQIGQDILDKYYDGYWSGTSVAAPMVSGALALIKSTNPNLNRRETLEVLFNTADKIDALNPQYVNKLGQGRLNIERALLEAKFRLSQGENDILIGMKRNGSRIKITNYDNGLISTFVPFVKFSGGVNITSFTDKNASLILAVPASSGGPQIKIFDTSGLLKRQFFVYDKNFRGGVNIATGDINNDGQVEIITAPASMGGPQVRIFSIEGKLLGQFFAYDQNFRGGVNLAVGDMDNDNFLEIITAPASLGGPQVKIFDKQGKLKKSAWIGDKKIRTGLRLAVGDFSGRSLDRKLNLVVNMIENNANYIYLYNTGLERDLKFKINSKTTGSLAVADINKDGYSEILVGDNVGSKIVTYDSLGILRNEFLGFDPGFKGGVNLSTIKR
ncbi:MAG: S8 family peptidase [bacterium]